MKSILKISIGIVIIFSLFFSINGTDSSEEKPVISSIENTLNQDKNTFKQDMLESIMEFANDSVLVDSLYIPVWLQ